MSMRDEPVEGVRTASLVMVDRTAAVGVLAFERLDDAVAAGIRRLHAEERRRHPVRRFFREPFIAKDVTCSHHDVHLQDSVGF